MSDEIKKGDVVRLKSGGPDMTVQNIADYSNYGIEDGANCVWFDGKTKKQEVFDRLTLVQVDQQANEGAVRKVVRG